MRRSLPRNRRRGALLLAGTAVCVCVAGARIAMAQEVDPSVDAADAPATADYPGVVDRLRVLGGSHFAGVEIQEGRNQIESHWIGGIPATVDDYARSRPGGVTIQLVEDARFSRDRLQAASTRVADSALALDAGLSGVSVQPDGSGLRIDVKGVMPDPKTHADLADLAGLPADALTFTTGIGGIDIEPVHVK